MIVKVTETHIKNGRSSHTYACPIALALKEIYGKDKEISVGGLSFWMEGKRKKLPNEATNFIVKFDAGMEVKPFEFKI